MSFIGIVSDKGSPGVTVAAQAMAAVWRADRRILLAELDPAGGDLAPRFGLSPDPGVVQLASAYRRALNPEVIWQHTQELPGGVRVLLGPASSEQAFALSEVWGPLGTALASMGPETDVIADCGRWGPTSALLELLDKAVLVVVVARPTLEGVAHLQARLASPLTTAPLAVLLVGDHPYGAAEVEAAVGIKVLGTLAYDERAAGLLCGAPGSARALAHSSLIRSARPIAERIASGVLARRPSERPASQHAPAQARLAPPAGVTA
jgi:hypothetical protein